MEPSVRWREPFGLRLTSCMSKAAVFSGSLVVRAMCRILAMAVSIARVAGRVRFIHDPGARGAIQADGIYIPPGSQREKHRVLPWLSQTPRLPSAAQRYRGGAQGSGARG